MFREKYQKFVASVNQYNLIDKRTKKIVVGMSGGKDAAVMTHFLMEYKKRERPDIELELVLAPVPYSIMNGIPKKIFNQELNESQEALLVEHQKVMNNFENYWSQYMGVKVVPVQYNLIENRILRMNWSCILCFHTKMKAFNDYFYHNDFADNTLFACGWTKWDAHYTLLSHLLKSDGTKWYEMKEKNPQKYKADCTFLASFLAYPKINMGIPGRNIYRINPMFDFDDMETKKLSKELHVPTVADICEGLFGDAFEQDRRFLSEYIEIFTRNQRHMKISDDSFLLSYESLCKFMQYIEILPPLEELENIIYDAYNHDFEQTFELLKIRK